MWGYDQLSIFSKISIPSSKQEDQLPIFSKISMSSSKQEEKSIY